MFEKSAKPDALNAYWKEKVAQLTLNLNTPFQKLSVAAKSLRLFAELNGPFDPLICALTRPAEALTRSSRSLFQPGPTPVIPGSEPNPWILKFDQIKTVDYPAPKKQLGDEDVKLWRHSFEALLKNPKGLALFRDFVEKELSSENLDFWERVNQLEETETRAAFKERAVRVYDDFIKLGSPNEINIPSHCLTPLTLVFEDEEGALPYACFSIAQEHIFALMKKDTYPRFCASKDLRVFAQKIKYQKKKDAMARGERKVVNKRLAGLQGNPGAQPESSLSYSDRW
jgi:hypothetical protein